MEIDLFPDKMVKIDCLVVDVGPIFSAQRFNESL
jgi:hypothetical protein